MKTDLAFVLLVFLCVCLPSFRAEGDVSSDTGNTSDSTASSDEGFAVADKSTLTGEEDFKFQAEIKQLMGIIVNSLYSNRDIFLRELISNAADAISKIRFLSLTNPGMLKDTPQLEIRIKADRENNQLHIRDTGVGMTREDLVRNLGSIAQSGTKDFLSKYGSQPDLDTIGQFGVGFYSAFLVADRVTVTSKNNDDDQYVWDSTADASFTIAKDPRGNTLGRGTLITLHLKEDASEYLDQTKLKELILRYNEFISYPVYLYQKNQVSKEVPVEVDQEAEEPEEEHIDLEEGVEVSEDKEDEKPKTQTVTEDVWDWDRQNPHPPLWTRPKAEIAEDEYNRFYHEVLKGQDEPLYHTHFRAEGDVEFNSLLYIPSELPNGYWDKATQGGTLKLYVKRVFITDNFEDIIPNWLNFIRGIVDSDDLPLNVSREMLQKDKLLATIKKKLIRKIIAMFQELASDKPEIFEKFYNTFSTNLKMGVAQDPANKQRLSKLLRFYSAKSPEKRISFSEYVEGMKKDQTEIFFLGGETKEQILHSPLIERLVKKGYDVLVLADPIDEYAILSLGKYDDKHSFLDVSKDGLEFGGESAEKKRQLEEKFEKLTGYLKTALSDKVAKVTVSNRLTNSPCALVSQPWGYSANMERIIKAQTLREERHVARLGDKRVLEINPRHPIMTRLLDLVESGENNAEADNIAHILHDGAVLNSGLALNEPTDLTSRLTKLMAQTLQVSSEVEDFAETEVEAQEEQKEDVEEKLPEESMVL